jgi:hypothetical protein
MTEPIFAKLFAKRILCQKFAKDGRTEVQGK